MRYPKFLKENGRIGFIAPSYGCNIEPYKSAFLNAQKKWEQMGYRLWLGPNCYEGKGIGISNTPKACGEEINQAFMEDHCDVIISCGGGELMCEDLPHVDFQGIKEAAPKWFMGFSDNTNLTFLLPTLCDTAAIYGPCAAAFGMEPWHPVIQDAWEVLSGKESSVHGYDGWEKEGLKDEEHPLLPYHITEKKELIKYLPDGKGNLVSCDVEKELVFSGRMIGGCLDCLDTLVGTRFDKVQAFQEKYKEDGFIWFFEACDLSPMGIRRAVWQLREAGWFEGARGFVIGRPLCFGEEAFGLDHYRAVYELLQEYQVPVIMDVDLGHLPPSMPIICGSCAEVRTRANEIVIEYILRD